MIAVLIAAAVLAAIAYSRWQRGVRLVLLLVVIEGALRKWLFPDAQQLLYFAKDFVLLFAFAGYLRGRKLRLPGPRLLWHLVAATGLVALVHTFNPALPNMALGLIGLKSYVFYSVLLILVPEAWPTAEEFERFLRRYVLLAIPTSMLAFIQFRQPVDSVWNRYSNEGSEGVATFGFADIVRVTSSFPYISGYTSYLLFVAVMGLALLTMRRWQIRGNAGICLAGLASLAAMPMTGSRGPVYAFAIAGALFIILLIYRGALTARTAMRALPAAVLAGLLLGFFFAGPIAAFRERAATTLEQGRAFTWYYQIVDAAALIGMFGYGSGATHNAAGAIVRDMVPYSWLEAAAWRFEDESARVIVELGLIGFVIVFALRLYLVRLSYLYLLRARDLPTQCLSAAAFVYLLSHVLSNVIHNPTSGIYYWFVAGMLVAAGRWETKSRVEAVSVNLEPSHGPHRPPGPTTLAPGRAGAA